MEVLPISQVRSLTDVPKSCQGRSGAQNWLDTSTPYPGCRWDSGHGPLSSVSHLALSHLLGYSPHSLGPERPLPSFPNPLVLSSIQYVRLISSHTFFREAMNSVPGCDG